jgi:hypothetical protein
MHNSNLLKLRLYISILADGICHSKTSVCETGPNAMETVKYRTDCD